MQLLGVQFFGAKYKIIGIYIKLQIIIIMAELYNNNIMQTKTAKDPVLIPVDSG